MSGMPPPPTVIALVGAESTGKTRLGTELTDHLRGRGLSVALVPEWLREWCDQAGRTPRADEQAAIAREQARRIEQACAEIVIADTTPLMTAVYSDMLFGDPSLHGFALARQKGYALTLVMGLDLPWVADGLQRDGPQVREPVDALLRAALEQAGIPYQVIYGSGPERLDHALKAMDGLTSMASGRPPAALRQPPAPTGDAWVWVCDKCSDPGCEHRLFTGLMNSRAAGRSSA